MPDTVAGATLSWSCHHVLDLIDAVRDRWVWSLVHIDINKW